MNEQVFELAEQAGYHNRWNTTQEFDNFLQQFAELIVKECAEIVGCNGHVSGFTLCDLIKKHFGVE